MTAVYKVSYVVRGGIHPGAIINEDKRPQVGQRVKLGAQEFEVVEVVDLMPARGDFSFLHVTLQPPNQ
ncbi:MAG: hypothetical protein ACRDHG_05190 [Anaerolineales bacterium]